MTKGSLYFKKKIIRDALIVLISIFLAIFLSKTQFFNLIINPAGEIGYIDSFITGTFFTSLFTTPLSIAAFAAIAKTTNIFTMALWGAFGALLGDLILFLFIKDSLAEDISYILRAPRYKKFFLIFKHGIFRWLTPLVGALVIASPLPDELGIAMMGLSRMKVAVLIPVSLTMNFLGIMLIGLIVQGFL